MMLILGGNTQIKYDTNSVELSYQGAKTFETVSGGVDVVGVLSTTGSATIGGDLTVTGNLEVQGYTHIYQYNNS